LAISVCVTLLYMCPHSTIYVSSYYYMGVLILLCMYPLPPMHLVCARIRHPPAVALSLSRHRHPFSISIPCTRFIRYNKQQSNPLLLLCPRCLLLSPRPLQGVVASSEAHLSMSAARSAASSVGTRQLKTRSCSCRRFTTHTGSSSVARR
jgi:hypothetical protein